MTIDTDFTISANGDIRYVGTTANFTVIALHRWLGDLMDQAQASGDDILDITDSTASERSTDNLLPAFAANPLSPATIFVFEKIFCSVFALAGIYQ